jgi:hypothetical protein
MSQHLPQTNYLDPEILQTPGDLELVAREAVEGLRVCSHRSPLRGFSTKVRAYLSGFNAHRDALRAGCIASHIDYTTIDTSRPLDSVLSEFFFQRQATLNEPSASARS